MMSKKLAFLLRSQYMVITEKVDHYYYLYVINSARQFTNMSMRAQDLELNPLYSPETFKISETYIGSENSSQLCVRYKS